MIKGINNETIEDDSYANIYYNYRSYIDNQSESIIKLISDHIEDPKKVSVLDVGSGPGRLALPVGRRVKQIVCVEPNPLSASHLRLRLNGNRVRFKLYADKIENLSYRIIGQYDLVILSHILHWFSLPSLINISSTFCKDNGYILLSYFDRDNLEGMLFYKISGNEILKIQKDNTPLTSDIKLILKLAGYRIVKILNEHMIVDYGEGRLKQIVNSLGTLAWQKLKNSISEDKFNQIKHGSFSRLEKMTSLTDTEYRTMILAKKVFSSNQFC